MNQKQINKKRVLETFKSNYQKNLIKITSNETPEHATTKTLVCLYALKNNYDFWVEPTFKKPFKGRADLVLLHSSGIAYAVEIVKSENKNSILKKKEGYPFEIIEVNANNFKFKEFCI